MQVRDWCKIPNELSEMPCTHLSKKCENTVVLVPVEPFPTRGDTFSANLAGQNCNRTSKQ